MSPKDARRQVCLLLRLVVRVIFRRREYIIIYFYLYKENAGLGEGPAAAKEGVMAGVSRLSTWFGPMTARAQGPSCPKDWATAADLRLKCVRSLQAWDAPKRRPWANTGELMRAFGRDSVESRQ